MLDMAWLVGRVLLLPSQSPSSGLQDSVSFVAAESSEKSYPSAILKSILAGYGCVQVASSYVSSDSLRVVSSRPSLLVTG